MDNEPLSRPGLARRIDLLALTNPRSNRRSLWFSGVLALWSAIGVIAAAVVGEWGTAAISLVGAVLGGVMWWVTRRAKRRVPETQRWVDELIRSRGGQV